MSKVLDKEYTDYLNSFLVENCILSDPFFKFELNEEKNQIEISAYSYNQNTIKTIMNECILQDLFFYIAQQLFYVDGNGNKRSFITIFISPLPD